GKVGYDDVLLVELRDVDVAVSRRDALHVRFAVDRVDGTTLRFSQVLIDDDVVHEAEANLLVLCDQLAKLVVLAQGPQLVAGEPSQVQVAVPVVELEGADETTGNGAGVRMQHLLNGKLARGRVLVADHLDGSGAGVPYGCRELQPAVSGRTLIDHVEPRWLEDAQVWQ